MKLERGMTFVDPTTGETWVISRTDNLGDPNYFGRKAMAHPIGYPTKEQLCCFDPEQIERMEKP